MKQSRKAALPFFAVCAFLLCLGSAAAQTPIECRKRLKIGVSLPLSAGAVASGEAVRNSVILADEKYDRADCVQFLFEDDQLLPKNTVLAVNKFISVDKVNGLIVYGTPTSIAIGDIVEKQRLPLIALSILDRVVKGRSFIMKHWCTAERLNHAVLREAALKNYKSVAIVSTQNDAMLGLRDLFSKGSGALVVLDEEFARDDFNFAGVAAKINSLRPDAVYVLLYPPQPSVFMKQIRQAGSRVAAFGVHNIEDPDEVRASSGAMEGMWLANGDDGAGEDYRSDYLKRFAKEPGLGGGSGFDAAKMFIEAAYHENDVNEFLHGIRAFHGSFGTYNATPENDFDFTPVIKTITPDGFVLQKQ